MAQTTFIRARVTPNLAEQFQLAAQLDGRTASEGLTPHKLRHTYASILYALGLDPDVVMDEMGHTDPALALRLYRHSMRRARTRRASFAPWWKAT